MQCILPGAFCIMMNKKASFKNIILILVLAVILVITAYAVLVNTKTNWKRTNGGQGFFRNTNENGEIIKSDCLVYSWDINTRGVSDIKIVGGADIREGDLRLWIDNNDECIYTNSFSIGHHDMEFTWENNGNNKDKIILYAEMLDINDGGTFSYDVYVRKTNLESLKEKLTVIIEMLKNSINHQNG